MVEEGEEVLAQLAVALSQSLPMPVAGGKRHDDVERMLEAAAVLAAGAFGQAAVSAGQHHGPQEQRLHARSADGVACLGRVATVTKLMCQADLPGRGMAALGAVEVGDPDRRTMSGHHLGDDTGAAAAADHVDHHLVILEHPIPASATVNAHAGLVRAHHPRPPQPSQNGRSLGVEARLAAPESRIERAFADGQAEQFEQQAAQPPVADVMDEAQVHRQRDDVQAERRTRLQAFG
jgi:hypothetical protein